MLMLALCSKTIHDNGAIGARRATVQNLYTIRQHHTNKTLTEWHANEKNDTSTNLLFQEHCCFPLIFLQILKKIKNSKNVLKQRNEVFNFFVKRKSLINKQQWNNPLGHWVRILDWNNTQTNFSLAASFWGICLLSTFILLRRLKLVSVSIYHS